MAGGGQRKTEDGVRRTAADGGWRAATTAEELIISVGRGEVQRPNLEENTGRMT